MTQEEASAERGLSQSEYGRNAFIPSSPEHYAKQEQTLRLARVVANQGLEYAIRYYPKGTLKTQDKERE